MMAWTLFRRVLSLKRFPSPSVLSSLDQSEEQQERLLKEMHKRVLFLAFEDPYRKYVLAEGRDLDNKLVTMIST